MARAAVFLNVKNPDRENDSRHAGSTRATSSLTALSAPARQVMNTNWADSCGIIDPNHYNLLNHEGTKNTK
jgi:hypothetical protein